MDYYFIDDRETSEWHGPFTSRARARVYAMSVGMERYSVVLLPPILQAMARQVPNDYR